MSLDSWAKTPRKEPPGDEKKGKKPEKKPPARKKSPAHKVKSPRAEGTGMDESPLEETRDEDTIETKKTRESTLKNAGLTKFHLICASCKFKKDAIIAGELKAHHVLCKKCGGEMKVQKRE